MIILLTDFDESEYVGMMKGVICSISPETRIIDLTHSIPPQSIREGAWVLYKSYRYFPRGSIFVCVVDPGVGTERDAILITTENYIFIGPDNGLMSPAAEDDGIKEISKLMVDKQASMTFHGRDVFAKSAAYYCIDKIQGLLGGFKPELSVNLKFYQEGHSGEVVRIDRFGNVITNIPAASATQYRLTSPSLKWTLPWRATYQDGPESELFLITNSYGTLEIAARNSSAVDNIPLRIGDRLTLKPIEYQG
ncbi:MAG: Chlorinase [Candidatus Thorarchaeota archaeon]|nr:MAG: Chlorinase [Candidatus Thorarchaeota archaeon]